jgi:threonine aldolase
LLADKATIHRALRIRKKFGGGMRSGGYLAAAGIYALNNNIDV